MGKTQACLTGNLYIRSLAYRTRAGEHINCPHSLMHIFDFAFSAPVVLHRKSQISRISEISSSDTSGKLTLLPNGSILTAAPGTRVSEVFVVGSQLCRKIFFDVVPNLVSKSVSYTSKNDLTQYVGHFFSESDFHYEFTRAPNVRCMSYIHILVYCVLRVCDYTADVSYVASPASYICCMCVFMCVCVCV